MVFLNIQRTNIKTELQMHNLIEVRPSTLVIIRQVGVDLQIGIGVGSSVKNCNFMICCKIIFTMSENAYGLQMQLFRSLQIV